MTSAIAQKKFYTINDIYTLPDGTRAEIVDGQIYYMAPPSRKHQDIAGELFGTIREYIKSNVNVQEIVDFLGANIFKNIGVSSCILTFDKKKTKETYIDVFKIKNEDICINKFETLISQEAIGQELRYIKM